jgi:hypothetical protein
MNQHEKDENMKTLLEKSTEKVPLNIHQSGF